MTNKYLGGGTPPAPPITHLQTLKRNLQFAETDCRILQAEILQYGRGMKDGRYNSYLGKCEYIAKLKQEIKELEKNENIL